MKKNLHHAVIIHWCLKIYKIEKKISIKGSIIERERETDRQRERERQRDRKTERKTESVSSIEMKIKI